VKHLNFKLASIFILSIVIIAYEIAVMRTFAVGSWSTFGSMVISIALLGFGLAGTILTFIRAYVKKHAESWLGYTALLMPVTMAAAHVIAQFIPFSPKYIAIDITQWFWIGSFFIVYAMPFFCFALYLGAAFVALEDQIHKLYFWNMFGSGLGGFFILGCMYIFPPDLLNLPAVLLAGLSAALCFLFLNPETKKYNIKPRHLAFSGISLAAGICLLVFFGEIRIEEEKPIKTAFKLHEWTLEYSSFSPLGEMKVLKSSYFHSAPGLSEAFSGKENKMPVNAFKGLFIDGNGPINIMRKLIPGESRFIDYLPMSAPYVILQKPEVLLIHLGGGINVFTALYHKAEHVQVVEPNTDILHLMLDVPIVSNFNQHLLDNPCISYAVGEPRTFCLANQGKFDLVEISLVDSVGLNDDGGYPVVENYTYTTESINDYMRALKPGGIISITVWNKLHPPRNVLRLLTTVFTALQSEGIAQPGNRMIMFHDIYKTATILIKNGSDFTAGEMEKIKNFTNTLSFDLCYYPSIPLRKKNFDELLKMTADFYKKSDEIQNRTNQALSEDEDNLIALLNITQAAENKKEEDLLPGDLYHFALQWLVRGRAQELYAKYIFDIRPATDDRPYYTAYLKPETIGIFLGNMSTIAEEWGYILLLGTLLQALIFGLVIILIPLFGRWKELFKKRKGTAGVIVYYACLGLGYMSVEIFLIQKLAFFLADAIFSITIVISAMLVISGLGSLFSERISLNGKKRIHFAVLFTGLSLLFYIFGLSPLLNLCLGFPFLFKIFLAVVVIAPAAFFMGMPFPGGLSALSRNRTGLLPWAWGMNGALSVSGAMIARILSVSVGFTPVVAAAIVLYIVAGITFPANEVSDT
jgi:SAM-dependent methyltransferase